MEIRDDRRKKAVALQYEAQKMNAPVVVASGQGAIAEQIIEAARRSGVPLQEDRVLVELLSRVEVGAEIPEAMYRVVAELFAALWSIDRSIGNARQQ